MNLSLTCLQSLAQGCKAQRSITQQYSVLTVLGLYSSCPRFAASTVRLIDAQDVVKIAFTTLPLIDIPYIIIFLPIYGPSLHRCLNISYELLSTSPQNFSSSYDNKIRAMNTLRAILLAPLFKGSSAFGSRNRYCRPTQIAFKFKTGFQSSRRMLRQTLPSKSMFG